MVGPDDVRVVAMSLPRTTEHLVAGRVKFRVGSIVYAALSPDGTSMGFAFPKEWRETFVAAEPDKFRMPFAADERYNWMRVSLGALDEAELRELIVDAWCLVVPQRVAAAHLQAAPERDPGGDQP
ncbi:MAG: hypothetical protein QOI64_2170 [Solirubrobacteraceae bacterium]|nr:hypothetical protein [Solirubrobacteraceae bacterium]